MDKNWDSENVSLMELSDVPHKMNPRLPAVTCYHQIMAFNVHFVTSLFYFEDSDVSVHYKFMFDCRSLQVNWVVKYGTIDTGLPIIWLQSNIVKPFYLKNPIFYEVKNAAVQVTVFIVKSFVSDGAILKTSK